MKNPQLTYLMVKDWRLCPKNRKNTRMSPLATYIQHYTEGFSLFTLFTDDMFTDDMIDHGNLYLLELWQKSVYNWKFFFLSDCTKPRGNHYV